MSASTLVKVPHCWKSHVTAHFSVVNIGFSKISSNRYIAADTNSAIEVVVLELNNLFCLCIKSCIKDHKTLENEQRFRTQKSYHNIIEIADSSKTLIYY